jgi:methylmalonyl-CoA/ethylmalonyl-CoA epimerase
MDAASDHAQGAADETTGNDATQASAPPQQLGKLRHIAITVADPHAAAAFYQKAFGLTKVGETDHALASGVYLSDGIINLALLNYKTDDAAGEDRGKDFVGLHHIGFWVDDANAARAQAEAAGAKWFMGEVKDEGVFYEVKFRDPNGIIFDISGSGWGGASKDGTPGGTKR